LEIYRDGKVFNCNHGGAVHRIKIL
jgi:hypothetical protein